MGKPYLGKSMGLRIFSPVSGYLARPYTITLFGVPIIIELVKQVVRDYGYLKKPDEVFTDHGPQFTANKLDAQGNAEHAFEVFLEGERDKACSCQREASSDLRQGGEVVRCL